LYNCGCTELSNVARTYDNCTALGMCSPHSYPPPPYMASWKRLIARIAVAYTLLPRQVWHAYKITSVINWRWWWWCRRDSGANLGGTTGMRALSSLPWAAGGGRRCSSLQGIPYFRSHHPLALAFRRHHRRQLSVRYIGRCAPPTFTRMKKQTC